MTKYKRKNLFIVLTLIVVCCVLLIAVFSVQGEDHQLYTENISDYNTEQYPLPKDLFPQEIPADAQVVSFSYYDYWYEEVDAYLELKFQTKEALTKHLSSLQEQTETVRKDYILNHNLSEKTEWVREERNSYNKTYTDIFHLLQHSSTQDRKYTGYTINDKASPVHYECNFGLVSYSYEELTVIHSYTYGTYQDGVNKHRPKYFERFNVPDNHERTFDVEWITKA